MTWVAVGVGAGTAVTGLASSLSAAGSQEKSATKANKLSYAMWQKQQEQMQPYQQTGIAGNELLNLYMGVDSPMLTREQLYEQLAPQYTLYKKNKSSWKDKAKGAAAGGLIGGAAGALVGASGANGKWVPYGVNKAKLNEAVEKAFMAQQEAYNARRSDPNFGMLTNRFTVDDFEKDHGYDFRRSQGELGINRGLASRGGYFSGQALKDLNQYNQDFASNEFNNAYQRDAQFKANMFNRLASLSSGGQQAAQYMGQAGANYANNAGNNAMAGTQASGAGYMGAANALAQGAGQGYNIWQGQQYLNALNKPASGNRNMAGGVT